jgi:hypothetical protein
MYNPTRVPIQITVNAKAPVASLANNKIAVANISDAVIVSSAVSTLGVNLPLQKIASTNYTDGLLKTAVVNDVEIINLIEAIVEVDTTGYGVFSSTSLFTQNNSFTKTEIANVVESYLKALRKSAMEQLSIGQLLNKAIGKKAADSIVSSESLKRLSSNSKTDILHIAEVLIKVATQYRSLVDGTGVSEKISKASSKITSESTGIQMLYMQQLFRTTVENTNANEKLSKGQSKTFNDALGLLETLTKFLSTAGLVLAFNESLLNSEKLAKSLGHASADTSALVESFVRSFSKSLKDQTGILEVLKRNISRLGIENINANENLSKGQSKAFNDALGLVETLTKVLSTSSALVLSFNESLLNSEIMIKAVGHMSADTSALVESFVRSFSKLLKDQTGILEVFKKTSTKAALEASSILETLARSCVKILSENTAISDKLVKTTGKLSSETTSITASCSIIMQNYGSSDYFAGNFVGISQTL